MTWNARPSVRARTLAALISLAAAAGAQEREREPASVSAPDSVDLFQSGYGDLAELRGPGSTASQLKEDDTLTQPHYRLEGMERGLESYYDYKARMLRDHGLAFGGDYTVLFQTASDSPGEDSAGGGILRLYGDWQLLGRNGVGNTGSLVFKGEYRHRLFADATPAELGFEAGYVGIPGTPFNDEDLWLTNMYWNHVMNEGSLSYVAGWVDLTDYVDVFALANPWTHFTNHVFGAGAGTIPIPGQGLGAALDTMLDDTTYLAAGFADANGDPGDVGDGFETFFDDHEFFTHVELGWTPNPARRRLDNTHVTLWQVDDRDDANVDNGWGINFSYSRLLQDRWLPFFRAGYSDDGGALLENSISAGTGYFVGERRDLFGAGVNWGDPSGDFGAGLDDQYTFELFYRFQLTQNIAVTPQLQFLFDPAINPDDDSLAIFGVRARLAL